MVSIVSRAATAPTHLDSFGAHPKAVGGIWAAGVEDRVDVKEEIGLDCRQVVVRGSRSPFLLLLLLLLLLLVLVLVLDRGFEQPASASKAICRRRLALLPVVGVLHTDADHCQYEWLWGRPLVECGSVDEWEEGCGVGEKEGEPGRDLVWRRRETNGWARRRFVVKLADSQVILTPRSSSETRPGSCIRLSAATRTMIDDDSQPRLCVSMTPEVGGGLASTGRTLTWKASSGGDLGRQQTTYGWECCTHIYKPCGEA
jgi:hypothetical protein